MRKVDVSAIALIFLSLDCFGAISSIEIGAGGIDDKGKSVDIGIGCYVYEQEKNNRDGKLVLLDKWVTINGRHINLVHEKGGWPCCNVGASERQEFSSNDIKVVLDLKQTTDCSGSSECVSTGFSGTMSVYKDEFKKTINIIGACAD